jgi:hypothetical protein
MPADRHAASVGVQPLGFDGKTIAQGHQHVALPAVRHTDEAIRPEHQRHRLIKQGTGRALH